MLFSTAKFARVIRDIRRELGGTERKSKQDFLKILLNRQEYLSVH